MIMCTQMNTRPGRPAMTIEHEFLVRGQLVWQQQGWTIRLIITPERTHDLSQSQGLTIAADGPSRAREQAIHVRSTVVQGAVLTLPYPPWLLCRSCQLPCPVMDIAEMDIPLPKSCSAMRDQAMLGGTRRHPASSPCCSRPSLPAAGAACVFSQVRVGATAKEPCDAAGVFTHVRQLLPFSPPPGLLSTCARRHMAEGGECCYCSAVPSTQDPGPPWSYARLAETLTVAAQHIQAERLWRTEGPWATLNAAAQCHTARRGPAAQGLPPRQAWRPRLWRGSPRQ